MTHDEVLNEVNVIYERISQHSKDYDSAWSDGNYTEALEILIDYYEVGFIDELEKIKAEIEKEREEMANVKDWGRYYGLGLSLRIIDNHISKLKGE